MLIYTFNDNGYRTWLLYNKAVTNPSHIQVTRTWMCKPFFLLGKILAHPSEIIVNSCKAELEEEWSPHLKRHTGHEFF